MSGTHFLKTAEGETYQDTKRKRPSEEHSLPGDRRGTGQDMVRKGPREGRSHSEDRRGGNLSGHAEKATESWPLTFWRLQKELIRSQKEDNRAKDTHQLEIEERGAVRTQSESEIARGTHVLERIDGGTS